MYGKYSLDNMLKICKENNELICAYLKGQSFEGYQYKEHNSNKTVTTFDAFGGLAIFLVLLVINLIIWIWALIVTIQYFKVIPQWAQIVSVLGLVCPAIGPVVTLIVVYVSKQ
jgi:hypothetical protein